MLGKEYEVFSADNGVVGVDHAELSYPDLILLDVILPVLSGLDACSLLKQDKNKAYSYHTLVWKRQLRVM